jgi:hypothetical protein
MNERRVRAPRYEQALVEHLLEGVMALEESTTYQAIVEKGRTLGARQEARKLVQIWGKEQCGTAAPAWMVQALEQIDSLEQLEALAKQAVRVRSWEELLPRPRRASGRAGR